MSENRLSRRSFITVAGLATGASLAAACGGGAPAQPTAVPAQATTAPEPTAAPTAAPEQATTAPETSAPASKYQEAPSLAEKVAAGELPPVEERLPLEPLVVECVERPGQYCGDLHRVLTGPTDMGGYTAIMRESLAGWDFRSGSIQVIPNIAKGWDISDDGKTYTFYLREGMRWSDGEPFTADDLVFWYEDVALNQDLTPSFPAWLTVAGEPVVIEKVDDYTVNFKFAAPYGILLEYLAFRGEALMTPKHYLSQFHPKYTDADKLAAMAEEAEFEEWYQLFADRNSYTTNPDLPVLWCWKLEVPFPGQRMISVRNPYYWKVDTEGKQLPYFDRLVNDLAENNEVIMMKTIAGEVDYQYRHMGFANYSLLKENEESGGYQVLEWIGGPFPCVYVNQSYPDLPVREILQKTEFRHALSYGINREEMNDLFWYGLAVPGNPVAGSRDPYWMEGFGTTAVEYNPEKANELLDSIGLDKKDGDGFRLRPDGQRLQLILECYPSEMGVPAIDIFSQVAMYWKELGIDAQAKEIERSLWSQRALANECMMPSYDIAKILWVIDPVWFVPFGSCYWGQAYAVWATSDGTAGEEPPEKIKEIIDWYKAMCMETDEAKRLELGQAILRRHHEEVFIIGTCTIDLQPFIKKNDLVNVIDKAVAENRTNHEQISWPWQVWRPTA
ncbi:MAG: ABC transporter substrate-binding protein [Anaerolineae bacterium]